MKRINIFLCIVKLSFRSFFKFSSFLISIEKLYDTLTPKADSMCMNSVPYRDYQYFNCISTIDNQIDNKKSRILI